MSLQKGFLQTKFTLDVLNIDKKRLIIGILSWLVLSFSIYSILFVIREGFRYTSFWFNYEDFLVLNAQENYFYNFVFACLACILAFTAISNHWIRRRSTFRNIPRYKKARIYHDKVSFSWYFIFWFSKMAMTISAIMCTMGAFTKTNLYPYFFFTFVFILINLFLHQWITLRLVFRNSILRWMIGTFVAICVVSSGLAAFNPIPYQSLNQSVLRNTISYHLSLELPFLKSAKRNYKRSLLTNIYVGFSKQEYDSVPQIFVKDFDAPVTKLTINDLEAFIIRQRSYLDEFEADQLVLRLNIDKHVKMKYVKELYNKLSRVNARKVQLASSASQSNGLVSSFGLPKYLKPYGVPWLSKEEYDSFVIMKIKIKSNRIFLNNSEIEMDQSGEAIRAYFLKNESKGLVELSIGDECSFDVYMSLCDQFVSSIDELRNEWTEKKFGVTYSDMEEYDSVQRHINDLARVQYPKNLMEID